MPKKTKDTATKKERTSSANKRFSAKVAATNKRRAKKK